MKHHHTFSACVALWMKCWTSSSSGKLLVESHHLADTKSLNVDESEEDCVFVIFDSKEVELKECNCRAINVVTKHHKPHHEAVIAKLDALVGQC